MKGRLLLLAIAGLAAPAQATAPPIAVDIIGTPTVHQVQWSTRPCYSYTVECSTDLQTWNTVGPMRAGTGGWLAHDYVINVPRMYYRIREHDLGFLTRPCYEETCYREDGVVFGFDLADYAQRPSKICIYRREDANDDWEPIGKLTDTADSIATLGGVHTVRGPFVWIPTSEDLGAWEVKAEVYHGTTLTASTTRQITIAENNPPSISIVPGPASSATPLPLTFQTVVEDEDEGDDISRVEFYDNGSLIGTDREFPFGDVIENSRGEPELFPNLLLGGIHEITAKAYDTRGGVGETDPAESYDVTITGGNVRPALSSIYPNLYWEMPLGNQLLLSFTASDLNGSITRVTAGAEQAPSYGIPGGYRDSFPGSNFYVGSTFAHPGLHTLRVWAEDNTDISAIDGPGNPPNLTKTRSYERQLQVRLTGTGYPNAQGLANAIADGTTAIPSAAAFTGIEGPQGANGIFANSSSPNLDMSGGVLLTTGKFAFWDDGNLTPDTEHRWGTPGDTFVEDRITSSITRDAATLEFDVNCIHGQLQCDIQFGSEEYPEFFNPDGLHDAFLVTINGVPVALVPDGASMVRAGSIHPLITAPGPFLNLPEDISPLRQHLYLNGAPPAVEYDGLTVRLRFHAFVSTGTHRVRFSIADTDYPYEGVRGYGLFDSALFIKSGSLKTTNPAQ